MIDIPHHPIASFLLDVADKAIKLSAVAIGGLWTWWNFRKSRTYEQRLELEVIGAVFVKESLYGDAKVTLKNIGATKHSVQHIGTFCELIIVREDLSEESIELFRVFDRNSTIEPGESINDTLYWRLVPPHEEIVWIKLNLRVVSNGVEWFWTCLVRVENED
jgi:hypothetical protein